MRYLILSFFLLSCCSAQPVKVNDVSTQLSVIQPAQPSPISISNPNWLVITSANEASVLKTNSILIAVTPNDFNNILLDFNDTSRFITQQNEIIAYYEHALAAEQKITTPKK
jgi:hypothetical protein